MRLVCALPAVLFLGVRRVLFGFVSFPGLVDYVGMNSVRVSYRHTGFGESELGRIRKPWHAFRPVTAAQDNAIPIFVNFRRSEAKIGDCAVSAPGPAAVDVGRVAPLEKKRDVQLFALA